ncbi:MAG: hypothetical protein KAT71_07060 [Gammaproteobacteria bacterium]|nr:hypothetical protein [Gammaproteobacteria bacterium]
MRTPTSKEIKWLLVSLLLLVIAAIFIPFTLGFGTRQAVVSSFMILGSICGLGGVIGLIAFLAHWCFYEPPSGGVLRIEDVSPAAIEEGRGMGPVTDRPGQTGQFVALFGHTSRAGTAKQVALQFNNFLSSRSGGMSSDEKDKLATIIAGELVACLDQMAGQYGEPENKIELFSLLEGLRAIEGVSDNADLMSAVQLIAEGVSALLGTKETKGRDHDVGEETDSLLNAPAARVSAAKQRGKGAYDLLGAIERASKTIRGMVQALSRGVVDLGSGPAVLAHHHHKKEKVTMPLQSVSRSVKTFEETLVFLNEESNRGHVAEAPVDVKRPRSDSSSSEDSEDGDDADAAILKACEEEERQGDFSDDESGNDEYTALLSSGLKL